MTPAAALCTQAAQAHPLLVRRLRRLDSPPSARGDFGRILASAALEVCMLHTDLFPELGCDGELIDLPEQSTQLITVKRCEKCETELCSVADDEHYVGVVYPGMKESSDWET